MALTLMGVLVDFIFVTLPFSVRSTYISVAETLKMNLLIIKEKIEAFVVCHKVNSHKAINILYFTNNIKSYNIKYLHRRQYYSTDRAAFFLFAQIQLLNVIS